MGSSRFWRAAGILALCAGFAGSASALKGKAVASGLALPLFVTAPAGDARVFIVEQGGVIKVAVGNQISVFLDLSAIVDAEGTGGLLGLAFDPNYGNNGRFYVDYVELGTTNTVVARYTMSRPDANRADPSTREEILRYVQTEFPSHRAGWLAFRPGDGRNLYISTGDGSHAYDPENNAQNGQVMLGKLLRIDVSGSGPGYAIPAGNPFIGSPTVRPEIWALGLRNPFRPSFDRATGDFWIADVGQDTREEINFEASADGGGHNYGWRLREGTVKTPGGVGGSKAGMTDPVFDYPHPPSPRSLGQSITGGFVYRGPSIPEADGRYFFGDYVANRIYSFSYGPGGKPIAGRDETEALLGGTGLDGISSFGEDAAGRLYAIGNNGVIVVMCPDGGAPRGPCAGSR